jgi:hypothetical protein
MRKRLRHTFSVEMKSKQYVKNISISDEAYDRVLFEGDLGDHVKASLVDDDVLEFIGSNGILRIGISRIELQRIVDSPSRGFNLSSEVGSYTSTKKRGDEKN